MAPPLPLVLVYHGPLLFATELGVQIISCLKLSYMACFSNDIQFADACFCHFSEMCKHIFWEGFFDQKLRLFFASKELEFELVMHMYIHRYPSGPFHVKLNN